MAVVAPSHSSAREMFCPITADHVPCKVSSHFLLVRAGEEVGSLRSWVRLTFEFTLTLTQAVLRGCKENMGLVPVLIMECGISRRENNILDRF